MTKFSFSDMDARYEMTYLWMHIMT